VFFLFITINILSNFLAIIRYHNHTITLENLIFEKVFLFVLQECYNPSMDPVTHTLVGVGMANAFFRKSIGPKAVIIMALASNLPDVDALVHLTGDPTAILMRRTFGHSILTIPLWALAFSAILQRFYSNLPFITIYRMALLGSALHIFFDLVNSFGVVLLWPLSDWRPELSIIFIIDLLLTGLLAMPLFLLFIRKTRPYLQFLSRISLVCVLIYVIFCGIMRFSATGLLKTKSEQSGIQPTFSYVFPEPLGAHRWRGVLREKDIYHVYLIHPFSNQLEFKKEIETSEENPLVKLARRAPLAGTIEWFFKAPVWTLGNPSAGEETNSKNTVEASVYDLRFMSIIMERKIPFIFHFPVPTKTPLDQ
jgi:inner membrane protein